jgi:hypothetical protein
MKPMPARSHNASVTAQPGLITGTGTAGGAGQFNTAGTRIAAALTTLFNFLALNLALVIASLPIVTAPAAVNAAIVALDRAPTARTASSASSSAPSGHGRRCGRRSRPGSRWRRSRSASWRSATSRAAPACPTAPSSGSSPSRC